MSSSLEVHKNRDLASFTNRENLELFTEWLFAFDHGLEGRYIFKQDIQTPFM